MAESIWFSLNSQKMSTGKLILGVLAGIAAGATLGILFAPDKGTTTRKKIYQKGDSYVEGLEEKFHQFVDGVSNKFDKIRTEAANIMDDARTKAEAYAAETSDGEAHKKTR
jgi:gas vesicle protein